MSMTLLGTRTLLLALGASRVEFRGDKLDKLALGASRVEFCGDKLDKGWTWMLSMAVRVVLEGDRLEVGVGARLSFRVLGSGAEGLEGVCRLEGEMPKKPEMAVGKGWATAGVDATWLELSLLPP